MKKIIKILLAISILCSMTLVFADEEIKGSQFSPELLNTFNILNSDDLATDDESVVTRAWYVDKLVLMLNCKNVDTGSEAPIFTDVPKSHYYYDSIISAKNEGIIQGSTNGTFMPDMPVTYAHALKMAVSSLGYDDFFVGNDIASYMLKANQLELTDGINLAADDVLDFENAKKLLYNALHADVIYLERNGADSKTVEEPLLYNVFDVEYIEGVVEADYYFSVERNKTFKNAVVIDGRTFSGVADTNLVGKRVKCYYDTDNDEEALFVQVLENEVVTFRSNQLAQCSASGVSIENENGKKKNYKIESDASFLCNGKLLEAEERIKESLEKESTLVKMIDNDENGYFDVVFIYNYKNVLVDRIDPEEKIVYGKNGEVLTFEDKERVYLVNKNEELLAFEQIAKKNVLSVCETASSEEIFIGFLSAESLQDTISLIDDEYLTTVDGKQIKVAESAFLNKIEVGTLVSLYFDFQDELVYVDNAEIQLKIAYLTDVFEDEDNDSIKLKIFDNSNKNTVYNVANKILVRLIDGTEKRMTASELEGYISENSLTRNAVLYQKNASDAVTELWFATDDQSKRFHDLTATGMFDSTALTTMRYKSAALTFLAKLTFTNSSSVVMSVPKEDSTYNSEEDYFLYTAPKMFKNGAVYNCSSSGRYSIVPISMEENGVTTDVLVWQVDYGMDEDLRYNENPGVIKSISTVYNEKTCENVQMLTLMGLDGSEKQIYYRNESGGTGVLTANGIIAEKGDIINCGEDLDGFATNKSVELYYDMSEEKLNKSVIGSTYYRQDYDRLSVMEVIKRKDNIVMGTFASNYDGTQSTIEMYDVENATTVCVFDKETGKIETVNHARVVEGDKAIAYVSGGINLELILYYE